MPDAGQFQKQSAACKHADDGADKQTEHGCRAKQYSFLDSMLCQKCIQQMGWYADGQDAGKPDGKEDRDDRTGCFRDTFLLMCFEHSP